MKLLTVLFIASLAAGCGKKQDVETSSQDRQMSVQKPVTLPEKEKEPLYVYAGTQFNDPFIPLDGSGFKMRSQKEKGELDPASLVLKGILVDRDEKMASLSDSSGNNYVVKNKRLYNRKGEIIEGIVGIVKLESVVIITEDKTVRELKLRTEEEY